MKLRPDQVVSWDIYFASVTSMQFHPRATLHGAKVLTIPECALKADEMILEREKRLKGE